MDPKHGTRCRRRCSWASLVRSPRRMHAVSPRVCAPGSAGADRADRMGAGHSQHRLPQGGKLRACCQHQQSGAAAARQGDSRGTASAAPVARAQPAHASSGVTWHKKASAAGICIRGGLCGRPSPNLFACRCTHTLLFVLCSFDAPVTPIVHLCTKAVKASASHAHQSFSQAQASAEMIATSSTYDARCGRRAGPSFDGPGPAHHMC